MLAITPASPSATVTPAPSAPAFGGPQATDRPGPPGAPVARLNVRFWDDEHTIGDQPVPVVVRVIGTLGATAGYATLRAAIADLGPKTAVDDQMAAIVHVGNRWLGFAALANMPGRLTPWPTQLEPTDVGGVVRAATDWRMPMLAALVDGTWVHRFHASPSQSGG